ncbi:MAG: FAD-dependent oxidoreductase [Clostridiales bacterium]|mgnify:CR=1 FL=1|nr:FAD-dependent oxidoreductase [Clostridiales bacterium]
MIIEKEKKLPVIDTFDVVVVGGGIAGVASALAAARNGAKVCLIEKENMLGGLATLGLVVIYLPLCDGMGNQVIGGIGEELLKASIKYGPGQIPECWKQGGDISQRKEIRYRLEFNAASFAISMEELLLENSVSLFYDTRFCSVAMDDDRIEAVIVENKGGRGAIRCNAVIDATGDADVSYVSGEKTVSVDTNRRAGWFYSYDGKNVELHQLTDPLYEPTPPGSRTYAGDDWRDVNALNIDARKFILDKIHQLRKIRGNDNIYPLIIPAIPQFRMTRRLEGQVTMEEHHERYYFNDTIGMTGDWRKRGPIYYIPFRSLIGAKIKNLITAGRCVSAHGDTWDVMRVIPPCAVTGQAAGTAAALLCRENHGNFNHLNINKLQSTLIEQGVIIDPKWCKEKE